jgi:hypothetical protein
MHFGNKELHHTERFGWLHAAVLGANDSILSTSSLVLGVAAAHGTHHNILVAGTAGLVAGPCRWLPVNMFTSIHRQAPKRLNWLLSVRTPNRQQRRAQGTGGNLRGSRT